MKIALIGYGKMGREVERLAVGAGDEIVSKFDLDPLPNAGGLQRADVCIEFSTPAAVMENMKLAADCGVDIVVGTTGWYDHLEEVHGWFSESALVYAQNFSVGVNVFYRMLERAAQLIQSLPEYDVFVEEQHHKGKADSPQWNGTPDRGDPHRRDRAQDPHRGRVTSGTHPGRRTAALLDTGRDAGWDSRRGLRFRKRHDRIAPHGKKSAGFCDGSASGRPLGSGEERGLYDG